MKKREILPNGYKLKYSGIFFSIVLYFVLFIVWIIARNTAKKRGYPINDILYNLDCQRNRRHNETYKIQSSNLQLPPLYNPYTERFPNYIEVYVQQRTKE